MAAQAKMKNAVDEVVQDAGVGVQNQLTPESSLPKVRIDE